MKRRTVVTLTLILLTVLLDLRLSQVLALRVGPGFDDVSIDWTQYHDYGNLTRILLQMNRTYSNVASVFSIGKSYLGREIWTVRLTDESSRAPKTEMLIVGHHHAREVISAETPLYLINYLAKSFAYNQTITQLLRQRIIYVVISLNVDSLDTIKQNPWQRKNLHPFDDDEDGRMDEDIIKDIDGDGTIGEWTKVQQTGKNEWVLLEHGIEGVNVDADGPAPYVCTDLPGGVDLNRNYGFLWEDLSVQSGSSSPASDVYRGPSPFSEPETRAIKAFVEKHAFRTAISFHSGTSVIIYPWSHSKDPTADDLTFRNLANRLSRITGFGHMQSSEMYSMSGDWKDWMYGTFGTIAFTIELYGNENAFARRTISYDNRSRIWTTWTTGIFEAFNPPVNRIEKITQIGTEASIALAQFPHLLILLAKPAILVSALAAIPAVLLIIFLIARPRKYNVRSL